MPTQRIANNFIKKYDLEIDLGLSVDEKLALISQKLKSADKSIVRAWNAKLRTYDKRVIKNGKNDNDKGISKVESPVSKKKATIKKSVRKQKQNVVVVDTPPVAPVKPIIRPPVKIKLPVKKPVAPPKIKLPVKKPVLK